MDFCGGPTSNKTAKEKLSSLFPTSGFEHILLPVPGVPRQLVNGWDGRDVLGRGIQLTSLFNSLSWLLLSRIMSYRFC